MRRVILRDGRLFTIYILQLASGSHPFMDFLFDLEKNEGSKLMSFIYQVADHGPPNNPQKSRKIKGESNLYELKSSRVRVLYFYAGEGAIVLTHGFMKHSGPPVQNEIDRAKRLRERYEETYG